MLVRHGPHQVAQNSTTYVLPFSNSLTSLPFTNVSMESLGAASPIFVSPAAGWGAGRSTAASAARPSNSSDARRLVIRDSFVQARVGPGRDLIVGQQAPLADDQLRTSLLSHRILWRGQRRQRGLPGPALRLLFLPRLP